MANYRTVHRSFWGDPWVESLTAPNKLLYLWLFTNPYIGNSGIMKRMSLPRIQLETSLTPEQIENGFRYFDTEKKLVHTDEFILVINFIRHQAATGPKILKSIAAELRELAPPKAIVDTLLETYSTLEISYTYPIDTPSIGHARDSDTPSIPYTYPIDTPSIGHARDSDTPSIPYREREGEGEKEVELEKEREKEREVEVEVEVEGEKEGEKELEKEREEEVEVELEKEGEEEAEETAPASQEASPDDYNPPVFEGKHFTIHTTDLEDYKIAFPALRKEDDWENRFRKADVYLKEKTLTGRKGPYQVLYSMLENWEKAALRERAGPGDSPGKKSTSYAAQLQQQGYERILEPGGAKIWQPNHGCLENPAHRCAVYRLEDEDYFACFTCERIELVKTVNAVYQPKHMETLT